VLLANHDEAGLRVTLKNICQERAGGGLSCMRVNDVNLGFRRLERAEVRRKRGFQLFGDNFELGLG